MSDSLEHYQELLRITRRRYQILQVRQAQYGIDVPPHVVIELEQLGREIEQLEAKIDQLNSNRGEAPVPPAGQEQAGEPEAAAWVWPLSPQQKRELVQTLLRCPSVADPGSREAMVRQLPPNVRNSIHRHSQALTDVLNIVGACQNYVGGLEALVDMVRFADDGTVEVQELERVVQRLMPGFSLA